MHRTIGLRYMFCGKEVFKSQWHHGRRHHSSLFEMNSPGLLQIRINSLVLKLLGDVNERKQRRAKT